MLLVDKIQFTELLLFFVKIFNFAQPYFNCFSKNAKENFAKKIFGELLTRNVTTVNGVFD